MKNNRIAMTESTEKFVKTELGIDLDTLTEEEIVQKLRATKKVTVTLQENGIFKVKQVLNG